jgi:hypothetical protein
MKKENEVGEIVSVPFAVGQRAGSVVCAPVYIYIILITTWDNLSQQVKGPS